MAEKPPVWPFFVGCVVLIAAFFGLVAVLKVLPPILPEGSGIPITITVMAVGCLIWLYQDIKRNEWAAPSLAFFFMSIPIWGAVFFILLSIGISGQPALWISGLAALLVPALVIRVAASRFDYEIGTGMKIWWAVWITAWSALLLFSSLTAG